jgi:hypothetical protein
MNYESIWKQVKGLPWCVLVTTGRTGTDFFQSLLDSHPEIFVFNGHLYFHSFWQSATCRDDGLPALIDEFTTTYIKAFKSRLDTTERKDRLGEGQDQSIDIDLEQFATHMTGLLQDKPVTSKNFLTAVYIAYGLCLGWEVKGKKLFFHHLHHVRKVDDFMADFPDAKIVCMTRDPRALYVSGVENWRRHNPATDSPSYPLYVLWRAVDEITALKKYNDGRLQVLKLEDLAEEKTLEAFCDWVGIGFDPCLRESSWAGMRWWGDEISENQVPENERGFSKTMITNKWEQRLGVLDKAVLNYLLADLLGWYGYPHERRDGLFTACAMALAVLVPTGYERRFLGPRYLARVLAEAKLHKFVASFYHPLRRMMRFYRWFWRRNAGIFFTAPVLGQDTP